ncbi:HAD family hydrolase [Streptomyces anulatus]|uniref:HAD family hydrolase n=1 Tax=Streptomyces anulatus TaxID=1892 RepID=UPI003627739E
MVWDIDHTLIATRGVGREIFGDAFEQVTGTPMREQATVDGMTEPVIFRRTAELHGITSDRTMFEEFARRSAELHRQRAHDLRERGHALPGVAAALATLADMNGIVQSVVTGNIRPVAEVNSKSSGSTPTSGSRTAVTARTMTTAPSWSAPPSHAPVRPRAPTSPWPTSCSSDTHPQM